MNNDIAHTDGYSAFDMSEALESINKGVNRWNTDQMFPISGNMNSSAVGSGNSSGTTTFQFQDNVSWWSPKQSYFNLRLKFTVGNGGVIANSRNVLGVGTPAPSPANPNWVTYADNFVCTLFTQIQSYINSQPLDIVTTPWIIDTALGYSKAHWNFIKTYANMTRMGEPLSTRLLNVSQNGGIVEVAFRPCISIFDVSLFPPGAQFRFDFIWAATAANAFEALLVNPIAIGTGAGQYQITVQDFSFYKCGVQPSPGLALPSRGVIDLCPATANQYFATSTQTMQQTISLPGTTNRILIVWQDLANTPITPGTSASLPSAPDNVFTGVGGGFAPATSFTTIFQRSDTTPAATGPKFSDDSSLLQQLYIILPELGIQCPKPQYTFSAGNNIDYIRAYSDWAHICQGTMYNTEGSLPFGNNDPSLGIGLTVNGSGGTVGSTAGVTSQPGDRDNYQQLWSVTTPATTALPITTLNQTSRWGWSGTRPGPIFAFPVIRPEYKHVSQGTLYANFTNPVKNACATVIATYSMAIAVEDTGNGIYSYSLVSGV